MLLEDLAQEPRHRKPVQVGFGMILDGDSCFLTEQIVYLRVVTQERQQQLETLPVEVEAAEVNSVALDEPVHFLGPAFVEDTKGTIVDDPVLLALLVRHLENDLPQASEHHV